MGRYWVFHDRRLKGPLEPEGLKALDGFAADTRVCPEGGPETDWRPAREHDELNALFHRSPPPAAAPAGLPSIPKLTPLLASEPLAAPMPPPAPAIDPSRVEALESRLAELQRSVDDQRKLIEDLRRGKMEADRQVEELSSAVASALEQVSQLKARPVPEPVSAPPAPVPAPAVEPPAMEPPKSAETPAPLPLPPPFTPLEHEPAPPAEKPFELPPAPAVEPPPQKAPDKTVVFEIPPLAPAPDKKATPVEDRTVVLEPGGLPDAPVPAAKTPAAGERRLKILSADDDELMRQAIASTFKKAGHDVDTVPDGTKALEMIASNFYDIVVLDETMPSGSGFQVARAVSRVDADSRPKVLIFTSQPVGSKLARDTFLMSGADDVLSKEAGMAGLLKKVCELTGLPIPAP